MNNDASKPTRRDFVKQSSLLAGGLIAAPFLSRANYFSGSADTIKIALVGCGGRGTGAVTQALMTTQNIKLVAMCDAFRDNLDNCYKTITADDMSETTGKPGNFKSRIDVPEERKFTGFDGYKKAIALADVVILTTPPGFRPIHFEEAIAQNKHVFMEKPVATDPAGIQRVLATAAIAIAKRASCLVCVVPLLLVFCAKLVAFIALTWLVAVATTALIAGLLLQMAVVLTKNCKVVSPMFSWLICSPFIILNF